LLVLLDERFDPLLRERAVISFYRYKGDPYILHPRP